jgi:hypothetical protein
VSLCTHVNFRHNAFEAGLNDNSTVKYAAEHFYQLGGGMDTIKTGIYLATTTLSKSLPKY